MLSKKDGEIIRVMASVSVVIAHCIHYWVKDFAQSREVFSLGYLASLADQLTRFTVPAFLFLSGFGLALQVQARGLDIKRYYRTRMFKIVAPFLLWSSITSFRHVDYFKALDWQHQFGSSLGDVLFFAFVRGFDYQYYFLIVLFQFYLVFPFVFRLAASRFWLYGFVSLHLLYMTPTEVLLEALGISLPRFHSHFIITHWLFCFVGMHAALNKNFFMPSLNRWSLNGTFAFWLFSFALVAGEFTSNILGGKSLGNSDHFNRLSVVLFCMASLMFFIKLRPTLERRFYPRPIASFLVTHVAPFTYFVYLGHTHLLRFAEAYLPRQGALDMGLRILFVVGGSYLSAWVLQSLLRKIPAVRVWVGLPKRAEVDWKNFGSRPPSTYASTGNLPYPGLEPRVSREPISTPDPDRDDLVLREGARMTMRLENP